MILADVRRRLGFLLRIKQLGRKPDVLTPTIDDRAAPRGLTFSNYYVHPFARRRAPLARASLMSGRYSIHTGSEHILVGPFEPSCLPVSLPIMPMPFKALPDTHDRQVAPRQRERVVVPVGAWLRLIRWLPRRERHGAGGFCDWHLCGFFGNAAGSPSPCNNC